MDNRIIVIGTSHVSKSSIRLVKSSIKAYNPDIVMIELCNERLESMKKKKKDKPLKWFFKNYRKIGVGTALFLLILRGFQRLIGKKLGIEPGKEMLTAYRIAKREKKRVELIDMPMSEISIRLSRVLGLKGLFSMIITSIIEVFKSKRNISMDSIFLDPREEEVEELKKIFKKNNPKLYRVLLEDRNRYMAKKAAKLIDKNERAVIVVGAAHARDVFMLTKNEIEKNKNQ
ncbi:TraB/GumN family protein [Candidatus Woesearchaeota archaeon]|nr:TraB/GumN family protein [Candidatus Woesearchaeota archaeon]